MATYQIVSIVSSEFQPMNDFILIQPAEHPHETVTPAGIIFKINQSSLDRPTSGNVVAVGKDIIEVPIGAFVLWPNTDGLDIEFNDGVYILLQSKSIIGYKKELANSLEKHFIDPKNPAEEKN